MAFYVGQKVECINATNYYQGNTGDKLTQGNTYIITKVGYTDEACTEPGVEVYEHEPLHSLNPSAPADMCRWRASRFRPLTSRPTSISIFTAMLGPKQKETIDG